MMGKSKSSPGEAQVIGKRAVRMILLKTLPGSEHEVYRAIDSFFKNAQREYELAGWHGFKVFGEYDICVIVEKASFAQDLSNAGTIPGITYSTELLCYLWEREGDKDSENPLSTALEAPLLFMSALKLKPAYQKQKTPDIESEISKYLQLYPNLICLGSFGWSEFVLLFPCSTFAQGFKHFVKADLPLGMKGDERVGLFLKSFTMVGVNYRLLHPSPACEELKSEYIGSIYPSISVSCRPSEIEKIKHEFVDAMNIDKRAKIKAKSSLGAFDFVVEVKGLNWGDFVERLIAFRSAHRESIFKTSIQLIGPDGFAQSTPRVWAYSPFGISITEDQVAKLSKLGHPVQESILATVYTFNQYLQNELVYDCVIDMIEYVLYMVRLLDYLDDSQGDHDWQEFVEAMPENIRYGCKQRLAGFFLQEGEEDFSPFKGGKQRLLKALKCFCLDIFNDIDFDWHGYVVVGRQYIYNHSEEVLSIPSDRAFEVSQFFGLFHEMGHVVNLNNADFWEEKPGSDHETELLSVYRDKTKEIFCDLFDYQCGFLGDYNLYSHVIKKYLFEVLENQRKTREKVQEYLLRSLCVSVYHQSGTGQAMTRELVNATLENIFSQFMKGLDFGKELRKEKRVILDEVIYSFHNVKKVIEKFQTKYTAKLKGFCDDRKQLLKSSRFLYQFEQIMNGVIVHDLKHPQLVVLKMLEEQKKGSTVPFRANMAAIQSFLKTYHSRKWEDPYSPYSLAKKAKTRQGEKSSTASKE